MGENNLRDIPYLVDTTTVVTIFGDINEDKAKLIKNPLHSGNVGRRGRLCTCSKKFSEFITKNISIDQLSRMKRDDMINIIETIGINIYDNNHSISVLCEFAEDCSDETLLTIWNRELEANHYSGCAVILHQISIPNEFYPM